MGVNIYNSEGYVDPTAYEALKNIEQEIKIYKFKENRPIVFICSPFAGNITVNIKRAKSYGRFAVLKGVVPIIPHLMYPQFLVEDNPEERKLGIELGLILLTKCREVWVFGKEISQGMTIEINKAKKYSIPIKYFTEECRRIGG
ncbi:DUF4406 domain-containing protein [Clostridium cochlearium]|uniref:DUF7768 domain-containing protein n=1 Tax=Clostridium cochlearium TaxID=1494 RepID=UPI001459D2B7|nr:DUF4406 domain-containing protein [Clostridium cochlearium]NME94441.1 DUF4406 domain-containing protein [Clostridium cochlearium]